jgi:hypothetical protein
VAVPIGFLFFSNQEQYCEDAGYCFRFSVFSFKDFVATALGWQCDYNSEWWFFKEYLFALLIGAIFISTFRNCSKVYLELFAVIVVQLLSSLIFPNLQEILGVQALETNLWLSNLLCIDEATPLFLMGIVFSKYPIMENWSEILDGIKCGWRIVAAGGMIVLCAYARAFIVYGKFDLALIPIYVFAMWIFVKQIPWLGKLLSIIGKYSTSMWLLHSFFIYYYGSVAKFIFGIGNWLLAYLVFFGITFVLSVLLDQGSARLRRLIWNNKFGLRRF